MERTVSNIVEKFIKDYVDLDCSQVQKARDSRDSMFDRINNLHDFLPLNKSGHMQFGSFARKTKKRPLDDIDMIICLDGDSLTLKNTFPWDNLQLMLENTSSRYIHCCNPTNIYYGEYILNSNKVKNIFKNTLATLNDCRNAELHSNQEAVTLQFSSFAWNFDIVPAFKLSPNIYGGNEEYYIIPNGNGNWKLTNPKKDRDNIYDLNRKTEGIGTKAIRLIKYWNSRHTMATIPSYMLEAMVLNFYKTNKTTGCVYYDFINILKYIENNIYYRVDDPKGIQGNINTLNINQKYSIYIRSEHDYQLAINAVNNDNRGYTNKAILNWREVFGDDFSEY